MGNQMVTQAVVVSQTAIKPSQTTEKIAFFTEAGVPIDVDPAASVTGADVVLTGMVAGTATEVAATDTVNEAIAKLQAQITALS